MTNSSNTLRQLSAFTRFHFTQPPNISKSNLDLCIFDKYDRMRRWQTLRAPTTVLVRVLVHVLAQKRQNVSEFARFILIGHNFTNTLPFSYNYYYRDIVVVSVVNRSIDQLINKSINRLFYLIDNKIPAKNLIKSN